MSRRSGLRKRLLFSHMGVAVGSLLTIMLLVNLAAALSLGYYAKNQQKAEADILLQDLETSYDVSMGTWPMDALMRISHQSMLRNYTVKIYDAGNKLVWDTGTMGMPMHRESASAEDSSQTVRSPISIGGRNVGTLEILGLADTSSKQNREFLRMFNSLSWAALLLVLAGSSLFSVYMADGISRPLIRIKQIASRMRDGDLSMRVAPLDPSTEVGEVGLALDHLADALERQDRQRKNLTADIAHELRTPLAVIQSHIEAFQDGVWQATPDKLEVCHAQVIRLVQLITDLDNLSAVENPMLKLSRTQICLNDVIEESVNSVAGQHSAKNITIDVQERQKVYVTGDYTRLAQVFVNLLNNAYKYTNEGRIVIVISKEGSEARVTIKDTGIGISREELPHIFERFYRGEKSRSRKTGGAGIGLAVVKAIVEAHGGTITAHSKVNEGSEFTVSFPGIAPK